MELEIGKRSWIGEEMRGDCEKVKKLVGKPPLYPGPRLWDERWMAKQLSAEEVVSAFKSFVKRIKIVYKLEGVVDRETSYHPHLLRDLAHLVLKKCNSTKKPQNPKPKDATKNRFYAIKTFALAVHSALLTKDKDVWWSFDFTASLTRLVLNKLRNKTSDHHTHTHTHTHTYTPDNKLRKKPRLCVDHSPLPVDARKKRPPLPPVSVSIKNKIHHDPINKLIKRPPLPPVSVSVSISANKIESPSPVCAIQANKRPVLHSSSSIHAPFKRMKIC